MIDLPGLIGNLIWVIGLAVVLAAASLALYRRSLEAGSLSAALSTPEFEFHVAVGFSLVCLGLGLAAANRWWQSWLWLGLALAFGTQAGLLHRRRSGRPFDLAASVRTWLRSERAAAGGIIVLALLFALLYALMVRPWMQADEPRHFEVIQHAARLGQLSVGMADRNPAWEQEIIADMEAQNFWWYGFTMIGWDPNNLPATFNQIWGDYFATLFLQQPLYYSIVAFFYRAWAATAPLSQAVILLRLLNVAIYGGALAGLYALMRVLWPDRPTLVLAVLALAALWPSHLATAAAVSNDTFVELLVVWMLYGLVRILRDGLTPSLFFATLFLGFLAVLSKRTGLVVVGALPLTLLLWAWGAIRQRRNLWAIGLVGLLAAVAGGLGILLWRTAMASGTLYRISPARWDRLLSLDLWREAPWFLYGDALLRSFVGWFGWFRLALPGVFYGIGLALLVLAGTGLLFGLFRRDAIFRAGWQRRASLLLAAVLIGQFALALGREIIWQFWQYGALPQARYLYPAFPAIALFLVLGWRQWIPQRWRALSLPAGVTALVIANFAILYLLLYPFYWL